MLQQFSYRRDANGNITQRHSQGLAQFPALTASYRYDELDRLRQERYDLTPERNADYTFDPNGNWLTRKQGADGTEADEIYSYAAKSNRLIDKDVLMQADAVPEPVKDVTYDAKQRVRTLSLDGQLKAEYRYDARNLRTKKTLVDAAGAVTEEIYYHYDANGLLIGESDAQGQVRREYVYLGMMPVAQIDIDSQGQESVVYFLTDQLATPRLGIDQGQAVVWQWESDAYGSIGPSGSATVNLRFAGQYFDAESGWYYNWNRYYLPGEGRYLTSDPVGLAGGINTYGYASQNPVNHVDLDGLLDIFIGGAGDGGFFHNNVQNYWQAYQKANPSRNSAFFEHGNEKGIREAIKKALANCERINIVGHSWGGDTAVKIATEFGSDISILITIDPVSRSGASYIPRGQMYWLNVNAVPSDYDQWNDNIAAVGGKWGNNHSADTWWDFNANHHEFWKMMNGNGPIGFSPLSILLNSPQKQEGCKCSKSN